MSAYTCVCVFCVVHVMSVSSSSCGYCTMHVYVRVYVCAHAHVCTVLVNCLMYCMFTMLS